MLTKTNSPYMVNKVYNCKSNHFKPRVQDENWKLYLDGSQPPVLLMTRFPIDCETLSRHPNRRCSPHRFWASPRSGSGWSPSYGLRFLANVWSSTPNAPPAERWEQRAANPQKMFFQKHTCIFIFPTFCHITTLNINVMERYGINLVDLTGMCHLCSELWILHVPLCLPLCQQPFSLWAPHSAGRWTHKPSLWNLRRSAAPPSPGSPSGTWCTWTGTSSISRKQMRNTPLWRNTHFPTANTVAATVMFLFW